VEGTYGKMKRKAEETELAGEIGQQVPA